MSAKLRQSLKQKLVQTRNKVEGKIKTKLGQN